MPQYLTVWSVMAGVVASKVRRNRERDSGKDRAEDEEIKRRQLEVHKPALTLKARGAKGPTENKK